ncbi:hypothetical protein CVT24_004276 [Panaeolus cyanescens]|uniref:Uncharacterized protein n=1 Tax=Panaeolus cyanescens TaxID=181874 RepID=A0A409VA48_9AGAR|nr:hypothetical protein CVT24_004276 [Panaeolus cyanescens]
MFNLKLSFHLMWNRVTFTRLTIFYFAFSVCHFIIQLSLQIKAFTTNAEAARFIGRIVEAGQSTNDSLPILRDNAIRMCSWVPSNLNVDIESCPIVWDGTANTNRTINSAIVSPTNADPEPSPAVVIALSSSSVVVTSTSAQPIETSTESIVNRASQTIAGTPAIAQITDGPVGGTLGFSNNNNNDSDSDSDSDDDDDLDSDSGDDDSSDDDDEDRVARIIRRNAKIIPSAPGEPFSVKLEGLENGQTAVLTGTCLWSLNWPLSILDNTKREDIVFIAFNFWVLAMSIVAILNESIPHILASLVTHVMATAWGAFQIYHTAVFRSEFNRVISNGACRNVPLLTEYWNARGLAEISSLALNIVALFISAFLTWKLIKLYGWQTFKRIGASLTINRVYKLVLTFSIAIQLSLFFIVVTVSLWLDSLMNREIGEKVDFLKLYKATSFITVVLLVPWLMTGWFAVRRELRIPMVVFLALSVLYLGGWSVMFVSTTFKWIFVTWRFFSVMATASVCLTVLSIILGVICRINFDKGLARYLNAQQSLPDQDEWQYANTKGGDDVEKVSFPSAERPLPTYASYPVPSRFSESNHSGSTLGPRFSNPSAEPFETGIPGIPYPEPVVWRNANDVPISRNNSYSSTDSSQPTQHSRNGSQNSNNKRWVIE